MGLAKFYAFVQAAVCGLLALTGVLGLATSSLSAQPALAAVIVAGLLSASAVAFLLRSDAARVFLAGLHVLLCLGLLVLMVGVNPVFVVFLLFSGPGAFAFVARDVRAWCAA
jgi:hypothetical protein